MVHGEIDIKELERSLVRVAAAFGEANETGISRWGVGVCRGLVKETQAWGDSSKIGDPKKKQQQAMMKDGRRAFVVIKDPLLVKKLNQKKLDGIQTSNGLLTFRPHQQMTDSKNVNDFIDMNRTTRSNRVPKLPPGVVCVTSEKVFMKAMRERFKMIGQAKGGWIGAGKEIQKHQKVGSRIAIGKNFAAYTHKFSNKGSATLIKNQWNPTGILTNSVDYVGTEYVLKKSAMMKALKDGAENTIKWYETAMRKRLNRRR